MKKVSRKNVSTLAMVAGNENKIDKVIHDGKLVQWVGIGWVELRDATPEDYRKFPEVEER